MLGAYCSASWRERLQKRSTRSTFFGTGETLLFSLTGDKPAVYRWVGCDNAGPVKHSQEMFMAADTTMLVVGGGWVFAYFLRLFM